MMEDRTDIVLAKDIARFYEDPLGFVSYAYPWRQPGILENHGGPDIWQREFLPQLGEEVKNRHFDGQRPVAPIRMATASGHGVGKGTLCAWLVDWILSTRPRSRGTITANTFQQLSTRTWAQIQQWTKPCITAHWFTVSNDQMYYRGQRELVRLRAELQGRKFRSFRGPARG